MTRYAVEERNPQGQERGVEFCELQGVARNTDEAHGHDAGQQDEVHGEHDEHASTGTGGTHSTSGTSSYRG